MNVVVTRRLEKWPDGTTRAKAARMLGGGASLAEVLGRYPDAVVNEHRGKPVEPARRAIYAQYALLQELQGEPDVDLGLTRRGRAGPDEVRQPDAGRRGPRPPI
jgi:hypothetical protein